MSPPQEQEPLADPMTELRRLTDALLDRLQPWLTSLDAPRTSADDASAQHPDAPLGNDSSNPAPPPSCSCPLCAVVSAARGDRPELTHRLTTHALTALRTLLVQHPANPEDPDHHNAATHQRAQPH